LAAFLNKKPLARFRYLLAFAVAGFELLFAPEFVSEGFVGAAPAEIVVA